MSDLRLITSLDINIEPVTRKRLLFSRFETVKDLLNIDINTLSEELRIPYVEAFDILEQVKKRPKIKYLTGIETRNHEIQLNRISTLSNSFDQLLGGGVQLGKITEFYGTLTVGKTTLGIQLCVNVQIPDCLNGPQGEALFIDTEGTFYPSRAQEIARETASIIPVHVKRVVHYLGLTFELFKDSALKNFIKDHSIKLIVIDSISYLFSQIHDIKMRTRLLNKFSQDLTKFVTEFDLAIVLLNQLTTKIEKSERSESWGHHSTNRIELYWHNEIR
ncbi:2264_t:CDS:2 [Entrophospora sp. SA101]|nr:1238_t:CDS:2 [Entrophospora sp. SA101]CAJ0829583.1 2264_t:CDS:2 [Entrophospora sp. SA101]